MNDYLQGSVETRAQQRQRQRSAYARGNLARDKALSARERQEESNRRQQEEYRNRTKVGTLEITAEQRAADAERLNQQQQARAARLKAQIKQQTQAAQDARDAARAAWLKDFQERTKKAAKEQVWGQNPPDEKDVTEELKRRFASGRGKPGIGPQNVRSARMAATLKRLGRIRGG